MPKTKTYEEKFAELESIVETMAENTNLEEALKLFEKGIKLSRECHATLNAAEKKVETLIKEGENKINTEDAE